MPLCPALQQGNEDANNSLNVIGRKTVGGLSALLKLKAQTGIFPCLAMKDSFF